MVPLESSVQDKGTNVGLKTRKRVLFKCYHLPLSSFCSLGLAGLWSACLVQNHTEANILSTLNSQVNTWFTYFFLALLYLITEEVFWGERFTAVSAEITAPVSVVVGFLLPPGLFSWIGKGISHPSQWWPFALCEAVAFDFIEVDDYLIAMKWERLNKTIVSQSKLLRLSEERDWFFNLHTIPAILRRPTSL